uniref:Endonuclease V n=1 Tax=Oryzias latipes TaxID=8090 RepID=A0A3P9MBN2_ORYLA
MLCDKSSKPVYVSVGHKISLDTAVRLTRACCLFRVPEPIRQVETFRVQWIYKVGPKHKLSDKDQKPFTAKTGALEIRQMFLPGISRFSFNKQKHLLTSEVKKKINPILILGKKILATKTCFPKNYFCN